jgi:hypothetical protein
MKRIEGKINQTPIGPVPGPGFGLDPSLFLELCCDLRKCFLKACACEKHFDFEYVSDAARRVRGVALTRRAINCHLRSEFPRSSQ